MRKIGMLGLILELAARSGPGKVASVHGLVMLRGDDLAGSAGLANLHWGGAYRRPRRHHPDAGSFADSSHHFTAVTGEQSDASLGLSRNNPGRHFDRIAAVAH